MSLSLSTRPGEGPVVQYIGTKRRKSIPTKAPKTSPAPNDTNSDEALYADLMCPITHMLPMDPILAPDERVYERTAYERYLAKPTIDERGAVMSPYSQLPMMNPESYIPIPYTARIINTWIDKGIIQGENADKWKAAREKLKKINSTSLNHEEQWEMGNLFYYGRGGDYFPQDYKKAFRFFESARLLGSVKGEAMLGLCKLKGHGTNKDILHGSHLLVSAARGGSNLAAYHASNFFAPGKYGMQDSRYELEYLELAVCKNAKYNHLGARDLKKAESRLRKIHSDGDLEDGDDDSDLEVVYVQTNV